MASIKDLKKEINYVLGDLINLVYLKDLTSEGKVSEDSEKMVDSIYDSYEEFIEKINKSRKEVKRSQVLKTIRKEYQKSVKQIVDKINQEG